MKDYGPESFGALNADDYDEMHDPGTTGEAVALLAELAGGGRTLELAIGTGRVALPLAAKGVRIAGMDASTDMIAKLREKPGGSAIPITIGDMAHLDVEGSFDLIFLIFNTFFNLVTQEDQVRCFERVTTHLNPGGRFLIEAFVPDPSRFPGGQCVRTRSIGRSSVTLETAIHDAATQLIEHQYVRVSESGTKLIPLPMRYAWPSEIDLMARIAGLTLEQRWGGWAKEPFNGDSRMHVSVYRKPH